MDNFFGDLNKQNQLVLLKEELAHCTRVLRKKSGDQIGVLNGKGDYWKAILTHKTATTGEVEIEQHTQFGNRFSYKLHLAVAPTKSSDRIEWLLEKSIETGIDAFSLIYTQRTERKKTNLERLEKISVSALKQSGQGVLPNIQEYKFKDFLKNCSAQNKFIASCKLFDGMADLKSLALSKDLCVLIGPEGDFTDEEYALAMQHGFVPFSLGPQRFRTETAALLVVMSRFSLE